MKQNDVQIIKEILKGDEKSLRNFYHHYQPRLLTFIKNKIANENDAEEILQDTLLATIEALRNFSFRSSLFTFICSIAMHKIIDFYRKKKIKNVVFSKIPDVEPLISTLIGPEETFDSEILKKNIKDAFTSIAPGYRMILKLKYEYGYSVMEIAAKLSISFKSAESQLFRARRAFATAYMS